VHESVSQFTEKFFQLMRRRVYTTPKSYLDLVACYKVMLVQKRDQLTNNRQKLANGLSKLAEANSTISDLKTKLVDLQPVLVQKTQDIKVLIESLTRDQLQHMAGEWRDAGASHVSVDTMGQGLDSVEGHLEALAQVADALDPN